MDDNKNLSPSSLPSVFASSQSVPTTEIATVVTRAVTAAVDAARHTKTKFATKAAEMAHHQLYAVDRIVTERCGAEDQNTETIKAVLRVFINFWENYGAQDDMSEACKDLHRDLRNCLKGEEARTVTNIIAISKTGTSELSCKAHGHAGHSETDCWSANPSKRPGGGRQGYRGQYAPYMPYQLPMNQFPMQQFPMQQFPQYAVPSAAVSPSSAMSSSGYPNGQRNRLVCTFCSRVGHSEPDCWTKYPDRDRRNHQ